MHINIHITRDVGLHAAAYDCGELPVGGCHAMPCHGLNRRPHSFQMHALGHGHFTLALVVLLWPLTIVACHAQAGKALSKVVAMSYVHVCIDVCNACMHVTCMKPLSRKGLQRRLELSFFTD